MSMRINLYNLQRVQLGIFMVIIKNIDCDNLLFYHQTVTVYI